LEFASPPLAQRNHSATSRTLLIRWLGPFLALLISCGLLILSVNGLHLPNPVLLFACFIVLSSFFGGTASGLVSVAITCGFSLIYWSQPGHLFVFIERDQQRLWMLMLTMPPLAMLTGLLQERAARQHRQLAALARRQSDDLAALGQLAAQLRESEKRYADSFEHAAIGIAEIALDGSWTRVNPALCAMLGYTQEQMLERTFLDVTHPDDRIENMELVQSLCDSEVACSQWSKRYLHSSGTIVWASISVSLVRSATGAPLYYVSQIQDRTEQRAAEHKVRELNANLMALLESTSDLIWVVDAERFGMVLFNDGLRRQYAANGWTLRAGVTPEDVLPEPQAGYWRSLYANTLIHGGHEIEMRLPGGASIYSVSLNVVRRKGQVYGISVFARDVTEKRYAENAILAAKERAEASNRAKHEFLANIRPRMMVCAANMPPMAGHCERG